MPEYHKIQPEIKDMLQYLTLSGLGFLELNPTQSAPKLLFFVIFSAMEKDTGVKVGDFNNILWGKF